MRYLSMLAVIVCIVSCKSTNSTTTVQQSEVETIVQGKLHQNGNEGFSKGNQVIKNEVDSKAFINKMNQTNKVVDPGQLSKIDFDKYMLVAIFDKVRKTGGYSLEFDSVNEKNQKLILQTKINKPGRMATSVITQPFLILKMPKTDSKIEVKY